ncbi:unnamed protein product [Phaedon cochleariae]|uniref:Uncharacterized protein n=1 Tax=Phaedon cochleariae TaxID=80249 RepID=A0A9N9SCT2_PHACE|nr:unnamed protein product [Phaedon cochleariae]
MDRLDIVSKTVSSLADKIENISNIVAAQSLTINQCMEAISIIKKDDEVTKKRISGFELQTLQLTDEFHAVIKERPKREKNIIITGIPETISIQDDMKIANEIVNTLNPDSRNNIKSGFRFGNESNSSRPRPFKAILNSTDEVIQILKNKNKISNSAFPNIKLNSDMTPKQTEHLNKLRDELKNLNGQGRSNFTINAAITWNKPILLLQGRILGGSSAPPGLINVGNVGPYTIFYMEEQDALLVWAISFTEDE